MAAKIYIIDNLDCANCAAKIERKFNDHPHVEEAIITFATKQLRLKAEDPDALIPELLEIARTVEDGVAIYPREKAPSHSHRERHHHVHDHECGCGHHHEGEHECGCGHHHEGEHECHCGHHHEEEHGHHHHHGGDHDKRDILIGSGLFVVGLVLHHFGLTLPLWLCSLVAYGILG